MRIRPRLNGPMNEKSFDSCILMNPTFKNFRKKDSEQNEGNGLNDWTVFTLRSSKLMQTE